MTITTEFEPGEIVSHITDSMARGCITAFMARGQNHSYEVQWGVEKSIWHLGYELRKVEEPRNPMGFWQDTKPK